MPLRRLTMLTGYAVLAAFVAIGPSASRALAHDDVPHSRHRDDDRIRRPHVPADIEVPRGYTPFFAGHAHGTQNYICAPAATDSGVDWLAIGPQATLFDQGFQQVITHFASKNPAQEGAIQATWQHSGDTSAVWGARLLGSTDPNYVAAGAIEWLILQVTGARLGPTGGGTLTPAVYIQRVNTVGGIKPPANECSVATLNTRTLVDYEADYYFYR
jgi:hypothetical protein